MSHHGNGTPALPPETHATTASNSMPIQCSYNLLQPIATKKSSNRSLLCRNATPALPRDLCHKKLMPQEIHATMESKLTQIQSSGTKNLAQMTCLTWRDGFATTASSIREQW